MFHTGVAPKVNHEVPNVEKKQLQPPGAAPWGGGGNRSPGLMSRWKDIYYHVIYPMMHLMLSPLPRGQTHIRVNFPLRAVKIHSFLSKSVFSTSSYFIKNPLLGVRFSSSVKCDPELQTNRRDYLLDQLI